MNYIFYILFGEEADNDVHIKEPIRPRHFLLLLAQFC